MPSLSIAPGRRGIRRLRAVRSIDELPHSDFERLLQRWLGAHGIGRWAFHHRTVLDGYGPIEIDLAWPEVMLALELEGADHVDRSAVHDHDTRRQNALVRNGWRVLRVTYRRWLREPQAVLEDLRAALTGYVIPA